MRGIVGAVGPERMHGTSRLCPRVVTRSGANPCHVEETRPSSTGDPRQQRGTHNRADAPYARTGDATPANGGACRWRHLMAAVHVAVNLFLAAILPGWLLLRALGWPRSRPERLLLIGPASIALIALCAAVLGTVDRALTTSGIVSIDVVLAVV